ncbi:hypothetical protein [Membranihabitans marinus]|uniref:hypothetical protein n=1 Tax=Membranihabitans marinus TaxID=1227546 RepID=UPI001F43DED0|nr:hypothetical protein [Membranihabitans marinus]
MKKNYSLQDWEALFTRELKGGNPSSFHYSPLDSIELPPYIQPENQSSFSIPQHSSIKHSFHWNLSDELAQQYTSLLSDYTLTHWFSSPALKHKDLPSTKFESLIEINPNLLKTRDDQKIITLHIDHINPSSFRIADYFKNEDRIQLWIRPSHDIYLNMGMIRGIQKALHKLGFTDRCQLYTEINASEMNDLHQNMIAWTLQCTASLLAGLNQFIWHLAPVQKIKIENLSLILNIPEILIREANLTKAGDAIQGSDFLEELSDQIATLIMKPQ